MSDFEGLRIALIGPLPPPAGGMANQMLSLVENLQGGKAVVRVVRSNAPYRPRWVGRLPVVRAAFRLVPYLISLRRAARQSEICHVLANSGWAWHLFVTPAIWVTSMYRVPVVVHYHGGEASTFLARSVRWVRWSMPRVRQLIVPSGYLKDVFSGFGMQARVIPNLVDLDRFFPADRGPNDSPHIVVARNLEAVYDNETAVRAFATLVKRWPIARLTLAGTGPDRAHLEAVVRELRLELQVTFAGRLDRDAMAALFRSADLCLNPSRVDNMPVSILEAMASGVPVVSTNVGGIPYMAQDGRTALLVEPGDPIAMATASELMLCDAPLRARIVAAALEAVSAYSWRQSSPLWLAIYRNALVAGSA